MKDLIIDKLKQFNIPFESIELEGDETVYITFPEKVYSQYYSAIREIGLRQFLSLEYQQVITSGNDENDVDEDDVITAKYRIHQKTRQTIFPSKLNETIDRLYGLIDPDGNFFECEYMGHASIEPELYNSGYFENIFDDYRLPEMNGWLKLTGSMLTDCEFIFNESHEEKVGWGKDAACINLNFKLTQPQVDFILEYKRRQGSDTVNFNFNDYAVDTFVEQLKKDGYVD